jgi:hypothetical protein
MARITFSRADVARLLRLPSPEAVEDLIRAKVLEVHGYTTRGLLGQRLDAGEDCWTEYTAAVVALNQLVPVERRPLETTAQMAARLNVSPRRKPESDPFAKTEASAAAARPGGGAPPPPTQSQTNSSNMVSKGENGSYPLPTQDHVDLRRMIHRDRLIAEGWRADKADSMAGLAIANDCISYAKTGQWPPITEARP